jgi:two-component system, OmpR family, sensor histidine kinase PrrB
VRLSTRTGLAALGASMITVIPLTFVASTQFQGILRQRVDEQLRDRAESAAILVAVAERISISELNPTIDAARVVVDGTIIEIGRLPAEALPGVTQPGWRTVTADGEQWRLLAVEVDDVPEVGDEAVIELAAPLGDVDARARLLRRRAALAGFVAALAAGAAGWFFGRRAARPLVELQHDTSSIGAGPDERWAVRSSYGNPEVDDVARALNRNLDQLRVANERRDEALATARSFAASATHELRTPLQSAMTNLDVAMAGELASDPVSHAPVDPAPQRWQAVRTARLDLARMGSALTAVRALSDAELVDESWFDVVDLADLVEAVVARNSRTRSARVVVAGDESAVVTAWADGVELAVDNLVRNALTHGARQVGASSDRAAGAARATVVVTIDRDASTISVDDDGPGVPDDDRARLILPFERGAGSTAGRTSAGGSAGESEGESAGGSAGGSAGSGLGLAFVDRVARAHGGRLVLDRSPAGGLRATLVLGATSAAEVARSEV